MQSPAVVHSLFPHLQFSHFISQLSKYDRQYNANKITFLFFLCGPVPNDPWTGTSPRPGGWGPLLYNIPCNQLLQLSPTYLFCTEVQLLLFGWSGTCRGRGFASSSLLNTTWWDLLCKLNCAATPNVSSNLMLCFLNLIVLCHQHRVYRVT